MIQPIFLVLGYGVPQNLKADLNYRAYLNIAFNAVFARAANAPAAIIVCGGPTNGVPPYDVTEAQALATYLQSMKSRPEMNEQADAWTVFQEGESLSSLENLIFAKRLMEANNIEGPITIFCEATREVRLGETARLVFGKVRIDPIDFDVSKNRYLDPAVTKKREDIALQETLWTLQDESRLSAHHAFYEKKFEWFRAQVEKGIPHVDIVEEWYKTKLYELAHELMPDHPLFKTQNNG
ncbi:MAG: YdcF family protein [Candidatus Uhrbacteria bacterium]|nr:YdcF family protein [Candidatus Uhrbacteria bacterium]